MAEWLSPPLQKLAAKAKPLPAAEQRKLAVRAHRGDDAAAEALIVANMRLIVSKAVVVGYGQHLDAIVQAGMVGMVEAIRRYNPKKANGSAFTTYAMYWVMLYMIQEHAKLKSSAIRIPRRHMKAYREGRLSESEAAATEAALQGSSRLSPNDAKVGTEAFDAVDSQIDSAALLEHLSPKERDVVELHYLQEWPQQEIARHYGISRQRVNQIVDESMEKMRRAAVFCRSATATWATATAAL